MYAVHPPLRFGALMNSHFLLFEHNSRAHAALISQGGVYAVHPVHPLKPSAGRSPPLTLERSTMPSSPAYCFLRPLTAQIVLRPDSPMAIRLLMRQDRPGLSDPYTPGLLHRLTGTSTRRPRFDATRGAWLLPKAHTEAVIRGLAEKFGRVDVWQYGDPRKECAPSCMAAQSPRYKCECACAGKGHGETKPRLIDAVTRTGLVIVDETFTPTPTPLRRFTIRRAIT